MGEVGRMEFREKLNAMMTVVDDLPTLPQIVFELERAIQDESSGASDVAFIMEEDVSLTANILKLANSAYYGTRGTIGSVQEAIARLGFAEVGRLVTTLSVVQLFSGEEETFDYQQFWKHSLMVGFAARLIAEMSAATNPFTDEEAYVAGLLHDSGVLLLNQYFQEEFFAVEAALAGGDKQRHVVELDLLGMDHGEAGAYLLEQWSLSENVTESVRWHHQAGQCPEEYSIQMNTIRLADALAHVARAREENKGGEEALAPMAAVKGLPWAALGVSDGKILSGLIDRVTEETKQSMLLIAMM
jgi:HD-like signal output (HDOD) protein